MSAERLTRCGDIGPLLVFYACDEVEPLEREQIDACIDDLLNEPA